MGLDFQTNLEAKHQLWDGQQKLLLEGDEYAPAFQLPDRGRYYPLKLTAEAEEQRDNEALEPGSTEVELECADRLQHEANHAAATLLQLLGAANV